MSGGHDNHGHDDHSNASPTEKTKKGFDWLGKVFWGLFLIGIILLVGFFIWRSFFHKNDAGPRNSGDQPVAEAPATARASSLLSIDVPSRESGQWTRVDRMPNAFMCAGDKTGIITEYLPQDGTQWVRQRPGGRIDAWRYQSEGPARRFSYNWDTASDCSTPVL